MSPYRGKTAKRLYAEINAVSQSRMQIVTIPPFSCFSPNCLHDTGTASQMAPYSLHSALLLTRTLWVKIVHYIGKRVPFGMHRDDPSLVILSQFNVIISLSSVKAAQ